MGEPAKSRFQLPQILPKMLPMNERKTTASRCPRVVLMTLCSVSLLWLAQPPFGLWGLGFLALIPLIHLISTPQAFQKRHYLGIWAVSAVYWLLSFQGLRHAHPAMVFPWLAFGSYLAVYQVLFVSVSRYLHHRGIGLIVIIPLVWVAQEFIRNYFLTGISALMLGHLLADVPPLIQIADLFGTYGISCVVALTNVCLWQILQASCKRTGWKPAVPAMVVTIATFAGVVGYGYYRINQPLGQPLATFALIQRSEPVDYQQTYERQVEIFQNYAKSSIELARSATQSIDAYVWPESMYSAANPLILSSPNAIVPPQTRMTVEQFQQSIRQQQLAFTERAGYVQNALRREQPNAVTTPELIVGCGVVRYGNFPEIYSGVINLNGDHSVEEWYGKTHLVMFGEYIPLAPSIPGLRSLVPPGMGLQQGDGGKLMRVGETKVAPNICIETAVERVTVNQMNQFLEQGELPDVIVTVTNDGWFDLSSVIDHHLRCAQLVSVACRRPILSSANNGPTAWIDSRGQIVQRVPTGQTGSVIATPAQDKRISLMVRIGDWPAGSTVLICLVLMLWVRRRKPLEFDAVSEPASELQPETRNSSGKSAER